MKKLFYTVCILLACQGVDGQMQFNTSLNLVSNQLHSADFSSLMSSYNKVYKGILSNPFDTNMGKPTGWLLDMSYWTGKKAGVYSSITWGKSAATNKAVFVNGDERKMTLHLNDITCDLGMSIGGTKMNIALYLGMLFRFSHINSSFSYHNGYTSHSPEKQLNGIWESYRVVGLAGVVANYTFYKKLQAHLRADYLIKQGTTAIGYYDGFYGKSTFAPDYLPRDVSQINQIGYKTMIDDTRGFRISIGLAYLMQMGG